ncbi:MAG: alpha/beta hydrolase [Kofleriaceae bacterium]|nr:alpha/beta hydrolase [Myxococcales bacterium]MCB9561544.1 alpha/beta hydrolase [Kofleriaceae bacterium]MCB9572261.1 alpha/beta hydrolase [Kofleriaceae bacterium]
MPSLPYAHHVEHGMFVRSRPGPAGAPTLVWLHGLGESGRCFEAVAGHPALDATTALIPDLPGYGRSAWPASPLGLEVVADLLAVWLRGRGGARPIVVGHSMGGVLAVLLAERHPDVVAQVVDVDGNVSIGDCSFSGRAARLDVDAFVDGGFADLRGFVWDGGATSEALRGYHASMCFADPRTFHRHARELVELSEPETMAVRLAHLPVPVTYVAGAPDGACARSRELLDGAGVATIEIAPAGHWPFIDQPGVFAGAVATLL